MEPLASRFNRYLLPGFAFKAFVIGGGYATGRELAEYFLPSGPWGGLLGMLLAMACWSVVCAITFLLARTLGSFDYGTFFRALLGRGAVLFDLVYACLMLIILSVFGAAAGEILAALFGWPKLAGTLLLVAGIAAITARGNLAVERLFRWVTYFLYAVYVVFLLIALTRTGERIEHSFASFTVSPGWVLNGLTYAGYNIIGAVAILPTLRHLTSNRDAIVAGALSGPLGMVPAILLFICMSAYYPDIGAATLPSDYMLARFGIPYFHVIFELMICAALLESGTGAVHAANQRIAAALARRDAARGTLPTQFAQQRVLPPRARLLLSLTILVLSIFVATHFGLVALIARGYRLLAYLLLVVYVLPLLTRGVWMLLAPAAARTYHRDSL